MKKSKYLIAVLFLAMVITACGAAYTNLGDSHAFSDATHPHASSSG